MSFENKKILITGGSSGIGKAIVSELYRRGARQFAVMGRDLKKMQALGSEFPEAKFFYLPGDVAKSEVIEKAIGKLRKEWGGLDILINNAGVVSAGALEEISDEDIIAQQNTNITGPILLTKHALPLLRQSSDAAIMNVSSGLGLIGMAFYAPYAASKAALRQFSEALRRELIGQGIHVMTVYPTATDTPMMKTANTTGMDTPEQVANRAVDGLVNREIDVIMGGERMLKNRKLNFEDPLQLDEILKANYEAMAKRASGHRSM
ncbi:SDR family oxidoreductase [Puia sp.]|jgi:NAD(P)-dependent dehydrogenase (short-subunit alcohol dehydrogenase family)|uniref:SDR family NAD(P)-dependent oxidoreductase n=1 Tax=Puia sp. TaxID=2045100 RepID=UPI002F41BD44